MRSPPGRSSGQNLSTEGSLNASTVEGRLMRGDGMRTRRKADVTVGGSPAHFRPVGWNPGDLQPSPHARLPPERCRQREFPVRRIR